jgi:hypothetical protein
LINFSGDDGGRLGNHVEEVEEDNGERMKAADVKEARRQRQRRRHGRRAGAGNTSAEARRDADDSVFTRGSKEGGIYGAMDEHKVAFVYVHFCPFCRQA